MHIDHFWKTRLVCGEIGKTIKGIFCRPNRTTYPLPMNQYEKGYQYPRPQMVRDSYYDLNGIWELRPEESSESYSVEVPYPPQAECSGYTGPIADTMVYRKVFSLPRDFKKDRILLHFGAVDQIAEVIFNGKKYAKHEGGYLPFTIDVSDLAICDGQEENELIVRVTDTLDSVYPYGKQVKNPGGMWYTPITGIWQTVWMESVPVEYIERITCNYEEPNLVIDIYGNAKEYELCFENPADGQSRILTNGKNIIPVKELVNCIHEWSPEDPYLYHFTLIASTDSVQSYFAIRTISVEHVSGHDRLCLNHKPYFFHGVLDQGYFSEGIYTPVSDRYYELDILNMKALGFNTLRKHLKIEPARFYYDCDRLGMVVFQDMVNNGEYNYFHDTLKPTFFKKKKHDIPKQQTRTHEFFLQHAKDTVEYLKGFPSILYYTVFNEGWGQFNSDFVGDELEKIDSSRIYDRTSGWFHREHSAVFSDHAYFHSIWKTNDPRPRVQSECGGFVRLVKDHSYRPGVNYGYGKCKSEEALTNRIVRMYEKEVLPEIPKGMSGVIYTQLSDVEEEVNGLYTYDRAVCKVNAERMQEMAAKLFEAIAQLGGDENTAEPITATVDCDEEVPVEKETLTDVVPMENSVEEEHVIAEVAEDEPVTEELTEEDPLITIEDILAQADSTMQTTTKKKHSKLWAIPIILAILVAIALGIVYLPGANGQMKFFTKFLMNKVQTYDLELVLGDVTVQDMILSELGSEYGQTADELYNYLKTSAESISYEIVEQDPQAMTTTIEATCIDGSGLLETYLDELNEYLLAGMDDGSIDIHKIDGMTSVIGDDANAELIRKAEAGVPEDARLTYRVTIYFEKQYGVAIPCDASEEMYDVATAGLYSQLGDVEMGLMSRFIPQMISRIFAMIQAFDIDGLEDMTGASFSEMLGMEEDSSLYQTMIAYFTTCASKITYDVGELDPETMTVTVACTHLDSQDVLNRYLKKLVLNALKLLFHADQADEINSQLFVEAAEESAAENHFVERNVVITFDKDNYTEFTVSDDIKDVVTANMYTLYPQAGDK